MLAKADRRPPRGRRSGSSSRSGTASGASCSATATRSSSGSRNERPLTRYFPELAAALLRAAPRPVRGRRRDRGGHRRRPRLRRPAAAHPPGRVAGQPPGRARPRRASWPSTCSPSATTILVDAPLRRAPGRARGGARPVRRPGAPHPGHHRPRHGRGLVRALRGRRPRRRDGQGPRRQPYVPDKRAQLKVKHKRTADCVVAGYRTHKSGDGVGLAAARPLRRRRRPAQHGGGHQLHRRPPQGAGRRAGALRARRPRRPPVGELGRGGGAEVGPTAR